MACIYDPWENTMRQLVDLDWCANYRQVIMHELLHVIGKKKR